MDIVIRQFFYYDCLFSFPDPHIQAPDMALNTNRYSYVLNNPLSYTDPSGYFFKKIGNAIRRGVSWYYSRLNQAGAWIDDNRTLVAVTLISIYMPYALVNTYTWNSVAAAALTGAVTGYIQTGSLRGAATGAAFAAVTAGIGKTEALNTYGKALAHGVANGVRSVMEGGSFGHGFKTAMISKAFSPVTKGIWGTAPEFRAGRIITQAIVGGTVSRLNGGKFENGAVTGAMIQALNTESEYGSWDQSQDCPVDDCMVVTPGEEHEIVTTINKDSILYEQGDASVLVKNDTLGGPIPQVGMDRVQHALDISAQEGGVRVNIISGFRGLDHPMVSVNHRLYNAIDIYIDGYSSTETATAMYASGHFRRVAGYPESNLQSAHGDDRSDLRAGCFVTWGGSRC